MCCRIRFLTLHKKTKKLLILGSTGSIGRRSLDVVRDFPEAFKVVGLSTNKNVDLLRQQIDEFDPGYVAVADEETAARTRGQLEGSGTKLFSGADGLCEMVNAADADIALIATVGISGLYPTMTAIDRGLTIALANKEVLVAGGELVMQHAARHNVDILPVDSEHSAIFQCIAGNSSSMVERIILTASGGPFRTRNHDQLQGVTVEQALAHPVWSMGDKITIDSATLMNKGFEVIECKHLFGVEVDRVEVVIHPQSIIHSMVEFVDGSVIALLSTADMYLPIQTALSYPERWENAFPRLDFCRLEQLTFERPDYDTFPCLSYAYEAARIGGTMPAVLNAANEVAVARFLNRDIAFTDIPRIITHVMHSHTPIPNPGLADIMTADAGARNEAAAYAL